MPKTNLAQASPLSAGELRRVQQVEKLVVGLQVPSLGAKAARKGYNDDEHRYVTNLLQTAKGFLRPFSHTLAGQDGDLAQLGDQVARSNYIVLDEFENRWLPIFRAAARRYLDNERREAIIDAFFEGLSQQAAGPLVVGSVSLFIHRYEEFVASGLPGASDLAAALARRGLDNAELDRIKAVLATTQTLATTVPMPSIDPAVIKAASQEQIEAYAALNDWYIDWATTLRSSLTYQEQRQLGLISGPRRGNAEDEPDTEDTLDTDSIG